MRAAPISSAAWGESSQARAASDVLEQDCRNAVAPALLFAGWSVSRSASEKALRLCYRGTPIDLGGK
jgi:hypothetical protein